MTIKAQRDPWGSPTPLDWASFYVEALKYGPGPGRLEGVTHAQIVNELEVLLRDAGVTSMTGQELRDAMDYYCQSLSRALGVPPIVTRSCFVDGLMHGIALAAGLKGEHRDPRRAP